MIKLRNTRSTYGEIHKALHWIMAVLIFSQFIIAWVFIDLPEGSPARLEWFSWHVTVGCTLWLLVITRLSWKWCNPKVNTVKGLSEFERSSASIAHVCLYLALVFLPISGYLTVTSKGQLLHVFGLALPGVLHSQLAAHLAGTLHRYVAYLFLNAIVLHVFGALRHGLVLKDSLLRRMLPGPAWLWQGRKKRA